MDMERALLLLRQKEIRAQVSSEAMLVNWKQAQQEASDDLRSIHTTRSIQDEDVAQMLGQLQFDPINPTS